LIAGQAARGSGKNTKTLDLLTTDEVSYSSDARWRIPWLLYYLIKAESREVILEGLNQKDRKSFDTSCNIVSPGLFRGCYTTIKE